MLLHRVGGTLFHTVSLELITTISHLYVACTIHVLCPLCTLLLVVRPTQYDINWFINVVNAQAGEIALKFEQDRAQKVVQLVGPRLVEIGRYNPVSLHFTSQL